MITDNLVGKIATISGGNTVKIIDVGARIKVQDLDGEIKECYYTDVLFLWEK